MYYMLKAKDIITHASAIKAKSNDKNACTQQRQKWLWHQLDKRQLYCPTVSYVNIKAKANCEGMANLETILDRSLYTIDHWYIL